MRDESSPLKPFTISERVNEVTIQVQLSDSAPALTTSFYSQELKRAPLEAVLAQTTQQLLDDLEQIELDLVVQTKRYDDLIQFCSLVSFEVKVTHDATWSLT